MENLSIVPADIVFILVIVFITARCIIKGFLSEIMSAASVIGGVVAGFVFSPFLTSFVEKNLNISWWNSLISFLIIFLVVYLVVKLLERVFCGFIERVSLERLDRSLGLFLGLLEGGIIVIFLVTIIDAQPFFPSESILGGSVAAEIVRKMIYFLPEAKKVVPVVFALY